MATGADNKWTADTGSVIGKRLNPWRNVPMPAFLIWSSTYAGEIDDLSPSNAPLLTKIGAKTGNDMASKK
jgi:hypothetical protein